MNAHDIDAGPDPDETEELAAGEQKVEAGDAPAEAAAEAAKAASDDDSEAPEAEGESESEGPEDGEDREQAYFRRDVERVTALFTRSESSVADLGGKPFRFARWSRPIAPAIFGLSEESAGVMAAGFREAAKFAGLEVAEKDDEYGANILLYVVEEWSALRDAPQLADLVPDLDGLTRLLAASGANQYRIFTFTPEGGLRFCVALLRYDEALGQLSAPSLALGQAVQTLLLWSDEAFAGESPVTVRRGGRALVKSRYARLLKAAYGPETPVYSDDPSFVEGLVERMRASRGSEEAEPEQEERREKDEAAPGDDSARRRRSRRRRGRGGADDDEQKAKASDPDFDPLGGDPRPLDDDGEDGDAPDEEDERS